MSKSTIMEKSINMEQTPDYLIRETMPDGTIKIRPRFSSINLRRCFYCSSWRYCPASLEYNSALSTCLLNFISAGKLYLCTL